MPSEHMKFLLRNSKIIKQWPSWKLKDFKRLQDNEKRITQKVEGPK